MIRVLGVVGFTVAGGAVGAVGCFWREWGKADDTGYAAVQAAFFGGIVGCVAGAAVGAWVLA